VWTRFDSLLPVPIALVFLSVNLWKRSEESKILSTKMVWLRKILGVSRLQKVSNDTVRNKLEQEETIIGRIRKRRLTWLFGHVERMENNRLPHMTLHCYIEGMRNRGRQRKTWIDNVKGDLKNRNVDIETAIRTELTRGSQCQRG